MPTPAFFQNYIHAVAAIRLCIDKRLISPALILIYATMDSYAWAVSAKDPGVKMRFEEFVRDWVLPNHPLHCTPTDLYAARCAILHTLTSESDLSRSGKAQRVLYAWGTGEVARLDSALQHLGAQDVVTLHVEDLANALFKAMVAVSEKAAVDDALEQRLREAAGQHYQNLETGTVAEFLKRVHGKAAD